MELSISRPQQQVYLFRGLGLSLMLSFVVLMSYFPAMLYAGGQQDEGTPSTPVTLNNSGQAHGAEHAIFATPMPIAMNPSMAPAREEFDVAEQKSVRLVFGGDVNEGRWGDNPAWHLTLIDSFENLVPLFQQADLVFFNAEGGLCDPFQSGMEVKPRGSNVLWVTPSSLVELQSAIGDAHLVVSQANNHTMNLGESCLKHGEAVLTDAGIGMLGAGDDLSAARDPYIVDIHGTLVGILAYADSDVIIDAWVAGEEQPGVVPMDPLLLREDLEALRPVVDFIVISIHSGKEFERSVTENQVLFALSAVQYGADLVIGHGSHVPQGFLQVDGTPIYFSLGNGMMDQCFPCDYAFYSNDVRKNVWLEVEIQNSELLSIQHHVYYSGRCMLPSIASAAIVEDVEHSLANIAYMDDWPWLSESQAEGHPEGRFSDLFVE